MLSCLVANSVHTAYTDTKIFTWTGSPSISLSWHQKTRDNGLLDGKDRILLRSLVLTQYQSVTDRQTDMPPIAYAALATLALRCAVKTISTLFERTTVGSYSSENY